MGLRTRRRRRRPGVGLRGRPRLGREVRLQAAPGARVVLGDACVVGDGCRLDARAGTLEVGPRAVLGDRCVLVARTSIAVGAGAVLGDGVMVVDFDHTFADVERPIRLQPLAHAPVRIGAGARIGHGACLLRGVTVGEGAWVGEHAVVTRSVPAGARVEGVPARPVPARPAAGPAVTPR
jgi:acetyltransferase-like isoleucine patch superfamily enzyme